jgi:hypothetical protein
MFFCRCGVCKFECKKSKLLKERTKEIFETQKTAVGMKKASNE